MRNLNENIDCAENKLELIKEILQMDCSVFNSPSLMSPLMHYKLSENQLDCMSKKAEIILSSNIPPEGLNDFIINAKSFKEMDLRYKNVHFLFIDKKSLLKFAKDEEGNDIIVSRINNDYKVYYIIINCNEDNLYDFQGISYKAYLVDDNYEAKPINISTNIEEIRSEFLGGVGDLIRKRSTLNGITEYITFPLNVVDKFRTEQDVLNDIRVKLVVISKECILNGTDANVLTALNNPRSQKKMSMAFQKNKTDFYDIGNMQP